MERRFHQLELIPEREVREIGDQVRRLATADPNQLADQPGLWPANEASAVLGFQVDESQALAIGLLKDRLDRVRFGRAVWMDSTMVYRATRLLSANPREGNLVFDSLALVDLDTFVRNVVLYDQVVYAARETTNGWADLRPVNELANESVFLALWGDATHESDGTEVLLRHLLALGSAWLREAGLTPATDQHRVWRQALKDIFGVVPDRADFKEVFPGVFRSDVRLSYLIDPNPMVDWEIAERVDERRRYLVADATVRFVFNRHLSGALDLPYHPTAVRMPTAQSYLAGRGIAAVGALDAAMRSLRDDRLEGLRRSRLEVEPAPVWATILLRRARTAADLWPALLEMRAEAEPLRRKWVQLDEALLVDGPERLEADLARDLRTERQKLWQLWGGMAAPVALGLLATAVAGLSPLTGVAALLGAQLLTGDPARLRARLLRPHAIVLADLGASVSKLAESIPTAQALWELDDETIERQRTSLAKLSHYNWL